MSKKRIQRVLSNSLAELSAGIRTSSLLTGGSQLSDYGTIGFSNNYSMITLNRIVLTYMYTGNGIFQRAIQIPILDAISKGMEIESSEVGHEEIEEIMELWEIMGCWDIILDAFTWSRLFGGGGIVINTEQDPEEELNFNNIYGKKIKFYDADRWILTTTGSAFKDVENIYSDLLDVSKFYLYGQAIDKSRIIPIRGKKAPAYIRRQLKGWGMSVAESLIRDMNNYLKTDEVLYEILDESKLDIYYIQGLANKLLQAGGTSAIQQRLQVANEIKNYLNALLLDANDKYEQKTLGFAGLAEIKRENRIGIAGAVNMPVTKLFGISAAGFNSGEDDIENYNAMVESEIRSKIKHPIKTMLKVLFANKYGYIPNFTIKFPSLRILSAVDEENVKTSKTNRILSLFERGLLNGQKSMEMLKKEGIITIDIDENAIPDKPLSPNGEENKVDTTPINITKAKAIKPNQFNVMIKRG
jgi:uncharacterized protein